MGDVEAVSLAEVVEGVFPCCGGACECTFEREVIGKRTFCLGFLLELEEVAIRLV